MELSSISITDCYLKAPQEQRKITINNIIIIIIIIIKRERELNKGCDLKTAKINFRYTRILHILSREDSL